MVAKARIIIVLILSKILLCEFTNKPYFGQLFKYQVPTGSVAQLVEQRTENPRVGVQFPPEPQQKQRHPNWMPFVFWGNFRYLDDCMD